MGGVSRRSELLIVGDLDDGRCWMSLSVDGLEDMADWFSLWEHAVAIKAMCVRQGRIGEATRLGESRRLGCGGWCVLLMRGVGRMRRLTIEISPFPDPSVDVSTS